ncbi:MAG: peptide-methionine (S)-S-oxide reductase MsrA [Deltaproteobacteria bacterium]|nr:peptide-methionine (S)-S-oxide reductase MsrA [Deltaproteobacteria bacterium]
MLLLAACTAQAGGNAGAAAPESDSPRTSTSRDDIAAADIEVAIFAGGCFWCTESDFEKVEGVISAVSGYIGGHQDNPTYNEVSAGRTGHTEAVRIEFDTTQISYEEMLETFWYSIDPTTPDRQFCDRGSQYRSGIFYLDEDQKAAALQSLAEIEATKPFSDPIVTEITAADTFFPAEDYHQDFYKKSPGRYYSYRRGCGRDARLEQIWGEKK